MTVKLLSLRAREALGRGNPLFIKIFAIIICSFFLSSCSVFSPVKTEHVDTYNLTATSHTITKYSSRKMTILVTPVESTPVYNTTQMAYTMKPYHIAYFVKNRWISTPAEMLHPLIVQSLQNTHYFRAVTEKPSMGHYDYILNVQLIKLQQEFLSQSSQIHLILDVQLLNSASQNIIATRRIDIYEHVLQPTPYAGVIAANIATERALKQITRFCLNKT
ncbi:MAG: ABC-type transport auxiliary lipoprotein family protein [Gammaproteobacteria bacterium]|nr:ABC-type transport auxiliary lipoprotein family protein [Gammaproteobacteria bacterium]